MKTLKVFLPLLLAGTAVVAHLPVFTHQSAPDLFLQPALGPLVQAESQLEQGRGAEALASFRLAGARAFREGQKGVFERVRFRIGAAGKSLAPGAPQQAWPFLSWYCLNAQDFTVSSAVVETWLLKEGFSNGPFEYALMDSRGEQTIWGARPGRLPMRLFVQDIQSRGILPLFYGLISHSAVALPAEGQYTFAFNFNLAFSFTQMPMQLVIRPARTSSHKWYTRVNSLVDWATPISPDSSGAGTYSFKTRELWSFNFIVVTGDEEPPPFQAVLVHTYEPL